jgi:hemoglobin
MPASRTKRGPIAIRSEMRVLNVCVVVLCVAVLGGPALAQPKEGGKAPAAAAGKKSLYDRLGGMMGITVVVDDFIERLVPNAELNKNEAIKAAREKVPASYLKYHVSALVCQVTGGPCKYVGRSMKDSHAKLNISEKEWGVMAAEFKKSLDKYKVPAAEQKELFEIVGTTKADIVIAK